MDWIRETMGAGWVPQAVFRELVENGEGWKEARDAQKAVRESEWLRTIDLGKHEIDLIGSPKMGDGEREVVSLAQANGLIPVIDEPFGRREARRIALAPIGTLGILAIARRRRAIERIGPIVQRMRENGLRFGDELVRRFLEGVGERWPP